MATRTISISSEESAVRETVRRAADGRPEAFSELYASHYRYVLWICRRYFWRPEDVEDAAAEVFLKLHRVLGSHDASLPFRPWLWQVTSRHCLDKIRRRERERRHCVEDEDVAGVADESTASPEAQVLRKEEQRLVREELERLPERFRRPLELRYYKRMSYNEIARALGRQLPMVKMILYRAKRELRRQWQHSERTAKSAKPPLASVSASSFAPAITEACGAD
jgi:RNA polymerase sigma-70 factor (ECF subfamily)